MSQNMEQHKQSLIAPSLLYVHTVPGWRNGGAEGHD